MTNKEQEYILWSAAYAHEQLQLIVAGQNPQAQTLRERRMLADQQLIMLMNTLDFWLPEVLRSQVRACLALRTHLWSKEYSEAYSQMRSQAQKEASPECLPASDSL